MTREVPRNTYSVVVGITSYGQMCGSKIPGVYTRVFSYLDWIESIVWTDVDINDDVKYDWDWANLGRERKQENGKYLVLTKVLRAQ